VANATKTVMMIVRVPAPMAERLAEVAARDHRSSSNLAKKVLAEWLDTAEADGRRAELVGASR
jgi:hypothetical protein